MATVAELFAVLGFQVDRGSLDGVHKAIEGVKRAALGIGAAFVAT